MVEESVNRHERNEVSFLIHRKDCMVGFSFLYCPMGLHMNGWQHGDTKW
jgi:hypothetical protein